MRLFTGVDLPEEVREKLERLLMRLRPCAHLKWSPVYNSACDAQVHWRMAGGEAAGTGSRAATGGSARANTRGGQGAGMVPNPHHPRVFWVGVQGGDALPALVKDIDSGYRTVGDRGGGSGIPCAFNPGAHQGTGAVAGSPERDRSARVRRIRRVPSGPVLSVPQPARAGRLHLHQAV